MPDENPVTSFNILPTCLPFVNYALVHNDVPLIAGLRVAYNGPTPLQNVKAG